MILNLPSLPNIRYSHCGTVRYTENKGGGVGLSIGGGVPLHELELASNAPSEASSRASQGSSVGHLVGEPMRFAFLETFCSGPEL